MFDAFLQSEFNRLDLPGLAVAITSRGQEQFATGYGHCDPGCQKPVTPDTQFGVASVTKLVTAIATMKLQDQRLLSLQDPVKHFYPELKMAADTGIQLRHLLSHSTGLPGLPSRFFAVNLQDKGDTSGGTGIGRSEAEIANQKSSPSLLKAKDLAHFINRQNALPLAPPGTLLNYSNESYCLLGGIIEKLTSEPYENQVGKTIFTPLNMAHSLVGGNVSHDGNVALPLLRDKAGYREVGIWDAPLFYPAGGVTSSARDLTRLISVLSDGCHLLSDQSRQSLLRPFIDVASRPDTAIGYGFGLEYQYLGGDTALYWHTGQRTGVSSFVAWVSGPDVAVSVLSQIANAPVAGIGFSLIGKLLHDKHIVWPQLSNRIAEKSSANTPIAINQFEGRYLSAEGFDVTVKRSGTSLVMASKNNTILESFCFIDEQGGIVGEQNFRFLRPHETARKAWALALDLRVLPRCESD